MYLKYLILGLVCIAQITLAQTRVDESIFDVGVEWQKSINKNRKNVDENFLSSPLGITVLMAQIRIFSNIKLKYAINTLLNWNKGKC